MAQIPQGFSSSQPNSQNISKKKRINLRRVFCPEPGKVWYAIDYSNIELRIFAHLCGDPEMLEAFKRGDSVHLLFAKILFPKEYAECERSGESFKNKYKTTLYQWTKNGNFALIYGAGPQRAENTYHVKGAYDLIRGKMPYVDAFMTECGKYVDKYGFVRTLGGYKLYVPRDRPHCAPNYVIQGSAGIAISRAMIRLMWFFRKIQEDWRMLMQVHDELVFEAPEGTLEDHVEILNEIVYIMESSGFDLGLDLPVEVDRIENVLG